MAGAPRDLAGTRSTYFARASWGLRRVDHERLDRALILLSTDDRDLLHDAHVKNVRPFYQDRGRRAVEKLRDALALVW